ncbi:hypothetical protein K239x_43380 [Planctomycetes bacterium K23_9]|uniref:Uncharacterized protein n=1 Tax=Stieleria marina TaxID=1930275 RepID=A0A517NYX2_9BACT|nr:hypothetical protein K239x_43380 [Planctomycetes bacterium K23_9]
MPIDATAAAEQSRDSKKPQNRCGFGDVIYRKELRVGEIRRRPSNICCAKGIAR